MKKHYMIAIAIGIIVIIVVFGWAYSNLSILSEGFDDKYTMLTTNNPGVNRLCDSADKSCFQVNVLDDSGKASLQYAKINPHYYIDSSTRDIMPIPYGNVVTYNTDGMPNGFRPSTMSEQYTKDYNKNAEILSECLPSDPSYNNGCVTYNNKKYHLNINYKMDNNGNIVDSITNNIVKVNTDTPPIDFSSISKAKNAQDYAQLTKYDAIGGLDTTYHDDPSSFKVNSDFGSMWVMDKNGQMVSVKAQSDISGDILYYQPGTYRFGSSNYVPNYEDSVFLSRLTRLSSTMPVYTQNSQASEFCAYDGINPDTIEEKCNNLNGDTCASTSCCVYLGGAKCVAGNKNGPMNKSNYSDPFVLNRDYYYYQGKCYGNCPTPNVVLPTM